MSTAQVSSVFTARDSMSRTLKNIEGSATRLDKVFGNLRGRIRTAFEFHVINRGIQLFEQAVRGAIGALPDLIKRGQQWAHTVDSIADITGMAAGQASELAAVAENVGVNSDGLGRMMNALARAVHTNGAELRDYGIRIKDSNGHLLDSYTIFQNVRQRIAQMGPSLQAAKLGQLAFGRAALESADLLTLTNDEWERQIRLARESGLILTEAGLAAAEEWERTQGRLQQSITGIGAQILQGVAPALIGLTNGVTKTINANMGSIVRFASGLVNFLASLVADLIGVQLDTTSMISKGYDKAAARADRLREQIDDMTNSNQKSAASHKDNAAAVARARQEQERLEAALAKARRGVANARGASTFTGGMSGVEKELWRQRKAQSVKDAQERVRDAQKALADHRKAMTQMQGVTAATAKHMRLDLQDTFGGGGSQGAIVEGLDQTLKDSRRFGLQISDAIKDAIFGDDQQVQLGGGAPITIRSGGLLDKLGQLGTFLGTMSGHLANLNKLLDGNGPLVLGILALAKVLPLGGAAGAGGGLLSGGAGALAGALSISVPQLLASAGLALVPAALIAASGGPYDKTRVAGAPGTHISSDRPAAPWDYAAHADGGAGAAARQRHAQLMLLQHGQRTRGAMGSGNSAYGPFYSASTPPAGGPMAGPSPGLGIANPFAISLNRVFRTWMGESSPTVRTAEDQLGSLSSLFGVGQQTADAAGVTATQTKPLGDGQLGVVNPNFGGIGTIDRFTAGKVPIDNAAGTYLGIWPTGGKKLPVTGDLGGEPGVVRDQLTVMKATAKWTQSTAARLGSGGDIVFWLKAINTTIKGRPAGAGTSSLRP